MHHDQTATFCLETALRRGEIVPYFQPLISFRTGKLSGFEVLSRWRHPSLGIISPAQFVPRAEASGLIGLLSEKVFCRAFSIGSLLPAEVGLSVNISPLQFRDKNLPELFYDLASATGFALERLTVELTETALVENLSDGLAISREFKSLGIRMSLDDFGTGFSSLTNLQSLPFDELKIDQSFVRSMVLRRESRKIVAAVVGLGRSLGLTTVAEGVEEKAQAEMLTMLGCELGQGWLYGKAVSPQNVSTVTRRWREKPPRHDSHEGECCDPHLCLEALPSIRCAQLQAIYDGAPVGLSFLDCDLRYVSLNRRLSEMNGIPIQNHLGRTVEEVVPEIYRQARPHLERALRGESVAGFEVTRPPVPGSFESSTLLVSYQPARDEAGEVVGISVAVSDITEHKSYQQTEGRAERRFNKSVDSGKTAEGSSDNLVTMHRVSAGSASAARGGAGG